MLVYFSNVRVEATVIEKTLGYAKSWYLFKRRKNVRKLQCEYNITLAKRVNLFGCCNEFQTDRSDKFPFHVTKHYFSNDLIFSGVAAQIERKWELITKN